MVMVPMGSLAQLTEIVAYECIYSTSKLL